jgi:hypothetical protein
MSTIDTHVPNRISCFLKQMDGRDEKSNIFISFYSLNDITEASAAINYLQTKSPQPIPLRKRSKEANTCVEVEFVGPNKMIFGFSPPSENPDNDLREIKAWFEKNNIEVKI